MDGDGPAPGKNVRIRRHEQRSEKPRLQVRRLNHLLRLHASHRPGKRPHADLLPLQTSQPLLNEMDSPLPEILQTCIAEPAIENAHEKKTKQACPTIFS